MNFIPIDLPTGETASTYSEYLETEYWLILKDLYLEFFVLSDISCDCCGAHSTGYIELHHVSYENLGKMEFEFFDIIKVDRECHEAIHEKERSGFEPYRAVKEARRDQFERRREMIEFCLDQFHFDLKRTFPTPKDSKKRERLYRQLDACRERGILSEFFVMAQKR